MDGGMKIRALAPWFGGNRVLSRRVGVELGRLKWCAVPFAGGMPELAYIDTRAGVACDKHRHIINLARVIAHPELRQALVSLVEDKVFHPDELRRAQDICIEKQEHFDAMASGPQLFNQPDGVPIGRADAVSPTWAAAYFISVWMGRGAMAGQTGEFSQSLSVRYTPTGGSSAKRYRSAVESIDHWHEILKGRWEFVVDDGVSLLDRALDEDGVGIYLDPPWPYLGDRYRHKVPLGWHANLARDLARFKRARVVVRYGDDPLIRELYPADRWTWIVQTSKSQHNGSVPEVLIVNGPARGVGGLEAGDDETPGVEPDREHSEGVAPD